MTGDLLSMNRALELIPSSSKQIQAEAIHLTQNLSMVDSRQSPKSPHYDVSAQEDVRQVHHGYC